MGPPQYAFSFNVKLISGVPIYKLDTASLDCGFPLWKIITICVGCTIVIVAAIILNRRWTFIKYHFYARFTNDDDSQDLSEMKYDAFVSCRYFLLIVLS